MKGLIQYIEESQNVNESMLGIAAGVIAGLIGYKMLKALAKGFAGGVERTAVKMAIKELDEIQAEMTSILEKYPDSVEELKKTYYNVLKTKGGNNGTFRLVDSGISLDKDIADFEEDDQKRFKELFERSKKLKDTILSAYSDWDLESFK